MFPGSVKGAMAQIISFCQAHLLYSDPGIFMMLTYKKNILNHAGGLNQRCGFMGWNVLKRLLD